MSYFLKITSLLFFSYGAHAGLIYLPTSFKPDQAKIVVVLHGCLQSSESMSLGTGWNRMADQNNLVIVYPQVPSGSNPLDCWSWFDPKNQVREAGQLKGVMDEVQGVRKKFGIPKADLFLTGISSGGATAAGLLACFPKEFKAAAIHSAPSYGLAQSLEAGEKVLKQGPPAESLETSCQKDAFSGSLLVIHGSEDKVVHGSHAQRLIDDFVGPLENPLVREERAGGINFTITDFVSKPAGRRARLIKIQGFGHEWSGTPKAKIPTPLPFFSEQGPNATKLSWDFFQEISRLPQSTKRTLRTTK